MINGCPGASAINLNENHSAHTPVAPVGKPVSLSILIVDDDPMVREATAWMLTDVGHEVIEAEDGMAALEHLMSHGLVDLIITDISMPRMSGLALVQEVQRRWPGLPVLLVSGRPQPPGTQPYMMKPFNSQKLLHAVAQIFDHPTGSEDRNR